MPYLQRVRLSKLALFTGIQKPGQRSAPFIWSSSSRAAHAGAGGAGAGPCLPQHSVPIVITRGRCSCPVPAMLKSFNSFSYLLDSNNKNTKNFTSWQPLDFLQHLSDKLKRLSRMKRSILHVQRIFLFSMSFQSSWPRSLVDFYRMWYHAIE